MTYPLTTTRLSISPLTSQDAAAFVAYRQVPEVARWQGWEPRFDLNDAAELIGQQPKTDLPAAGGWLQLAIHNSAGDVLHGDVAIHAMAQAEHTFEIGITLAPDSQNQGIALEALQRVIHYLFIEAGAHQIVASCDSRNLSAAKLMLAVGMHKVSSEVDAEFFKGEWISLDSFALLNDDWLTNE